MTKDVHGKLHAGLPWQKHISTRKRLFTSKLDLSLRKKLSKVLHLEIALHAAETWTLRKVYEKYLESFEMWRWRKIEKISWTDHVRNEEVLYRVKGERHILQTMKKRLTRLVASCIGTAIKNTLLRDREKEGRIEVTGRHGRRHKQLLDALWCRNFL